MWTDCSGVYVDVDVDRIHITTLVIWFRLHFMQKKKKNTNRPTHNKCLDQLTHKIRYYFVFIQKKTRKKSFFLFLENSENELHT